MMFRSMSVAAWLLVSLVSACAQRAKGPETMGARGEPAEVEVEVFAPTLTAVAANLWIHRSDHRMDNGEVVSANGLLIGSGSAAALVDTTWSESQAAALYEQASALGMTITTALVTHAHGDRVGGITLLSRDHRVQTYGLALTVAEARAHALPAPEHVLPEAGSISLAGTVVEYFYPGPAHAPDNLVVYLPAERTLFGGCMVRALDAGLGPHTEADLSSWRAAILRVTERFPDATRVIPGHGEPGDRSLLAHTLSLVHTELAEVSGRFGGG